MFGLDYMVRFLVAGVGLFSFLGVLWLWSDKSLIPAILAMFCMEALGVIILIQEWKKNITLLLPMILIGLIMVILIRNEAVRIKRKLAIKDC